MVHTNAAHAEIIPLRIKLRAIGRHVRRFRREIFILSLLGILSGLGNGLVPLLVGKLLDSFVTPSQVVLPFMGSIPLWLLLLLAWTLLQLFTNFSDWIFGRINRVIGINIQSNFVIDGYSKLLTLPVSFFKHHKSGELSDLVGRTSWMLDSVVSDVFISLAPQFISIIVGITAAFWLQPSLAWVLVGGVTLYVIVIARVMRPVAGLEAEAHVRWRKAFGSIQDAYKNFFTVKQAGTEEFERKRAHEQFFGTRGAAHLWNQIGHSRNNMNAFQRIVIIATQFIIFTLSVAAIIQGGMSIGELVAFNAYAGFVFGPFVTLSHNWQTFQNGLTAIGQSEMIFSSESERYEISGSSSMNPFRGRVEFRNVRFAYEPTQPHVLKDISFVAQPGQTVALVGETGVGKTTIAELISAYYFPNRGAVLIEGRDTREIGIRELRSHIAVVPQETVLFNTSVEENIRYGKISATSEEIREVARKAYADVFIEKFPAGYAQDVGERGIKLSVGQKQRIAIARAMLRDPRILILDEPTSALDAETERFITASLEELMRGRTTFIIAHRLSTVRKADKILVIKDGVVAEEGKHDDLIQIPNGVYRHLYELHIGLHE